MKTTKQTLAVVLLIATLIFIGGSRVYSECTEDAQHNCVGDCPVLWAQSRPNPRPVQPWTNHGIMPPCHKIQAGCKCEYRTSGGFGRSTCGEQGEQGCSGTCKDLYPTPQDAQNGTNPVPFTVKECQTFRTGDTTHCVC